MKPSLRFLGYLNVVLGGINVLFVMFNTTLIITGADTSTARQVLLGLNALVAFGSISVGLWILRRPR